MIAGLSSKLLNIQLACCVTPFLLIIGFLVWRLVKGRVTYYEPLDVNDADPLTQGEDAWRKKYVTWRRNFNKRMVMMFLGFSFVLILGAMVLEPVRKLYVASLQPTPNFQATVQYLVNQTLTPQVTPTGVP